MANVCMKTKKQECVHTKKHTPGIFLQGFSVTIGCSSEIALANATTFSLSVYK